MFNATPKLCALIATFAATCCAAPITYDVDGAPRGLTGEPY